MISFLKFTSTLMCVIPMMMLYFQFGQNAALLGVLSCIGSIGVFRLSDEGKD